MWRTMLFLLVASTVAGCSQTPATDHADAIAADHTIVLQDEDPIELNLTGSGWGHLRIESQQRHELGFLLWAPVHTAEEAMAHPTGPRGLLARAPVGAMYAWYIGHGMEEAAKHPLVGVHTSSGPEASGRMEDHFPKVLVSPTRPVDIWLMSRDIAGHLVIMVDVAPGELKVVSHVKRFDWHLDPLPQCSMAVPEMESTSYDSSLASTSGEWSLSPPPGFGGVFVQVHHEGNESQWRSALTTEATSPAYEAPDPGPLDGWRGGHHQAWHPYFAADGATARYTIETRGVTPTLDAQLATWNVAVECPDR